MVTALMLSILAAPVHGELRVVTYNVWGIRLVTPDRQARIETIADELLALEPDLVSLQEVWVDSDAHLLRDQFALGGLPYSMRFGSDGSNSGLLIVSAFPLERPRFEAFEFGREPTNFWHLDWAVAKGIAVADVQTPFGLIVFGATHLQSAYETDEYQFVQVVQALQAGTFVRHNARGAPVILAGDLNAPAGSWPFETITREGGLRPSDPHAGIDTILFSEGRAAGIRVIETHVELEHPVALKDGRKRRLSDHSAVVATFALGPGVRPAHRRATSDRRLEEARAMLDAGFERRYRAAARDMVLVALLVFLFAVPGVPRRFLRRRRWLSWPAAAATCWLVYCVTILHPSRLEAITLAREALTRPGKRPPQATTVAARHR